MTLLLTITNLAYPVLDLQLLLASSTFDAVIINGVILDILRKKSFS